MSDLVQSKGSAKVHFCSPGREYRPNYRFCPPIIAIIVIVIVNSRFLERPQKSQEPAYSQALNQNKIDRQRSRSRDSGRQRVRRLWWMVFGVETGREVRGRR